MSKFNVTLAELWTLEKGAKVQYLRTLVGGEVLCQFDSLSSDLEITYPLMVEYVIKGLSLYFSPVNLLSKQKRAMSRRMRKPHGTKVGWFTASFIDLNEYLDFSPEIKLCDKIGVSELNWKNWIVCLIAGVIKCMCRFLTVNIFRLKISYHVWTIEDFWIYLWRCSRTFL